jgi:hypothetical protein
MSLSEGIPARYGCNSLSQYNPELVVGLRTMKARTFFVNSAAAAGGNGSSWDGAYTTLQAAIGAAAANDLILVAPGHAESIIAAAGITFASRPGLTVIGLGSGSARPTITFTTATTADMDFDGANVTLCNFLFVAGIDALAAPLDINAADVTLVDCETRDVTGSIQTVVWIDSDANASRFQLIRPTHRGATDAGATHWWRCVGGDGAVLEDPQIDANCSTSLVENVTTACTNFQAYGGVRRAAYMRNRNSADTCIVMAATSTGFIGPNLNAMLTDNAANITEAFAGAAMVFIQPINIVNLAGESSMQTNITASTDA